jgi:hypothetical protein
MTAPRRDLRHTNRDVITTTGRVTGRPHIAREQHIGDRYV